MFPIVQPQANESTLTGQPQPGRLNTASRPGLIKDTAKTQLAWLLIFSRHPDRGGAPGRCENQRGIVPGETPDLSGRAFNPAVPLPHECGVAFGLSIFIFKQSNSVRSTSNNQLK